MGNPSSKHCYFTGNYAGDGCVNLGTAKVYLKDNVGTLHPVKQQLGNYHCWIMRGALLIDPTHDAFGKPADAFSDRLYFPFDEPLASEVKHDLYRTVRGLYGSDEATNAALLGRAGAQFYPFGHCYQNCLAYERAHTNCKLVIGAVGYKCYEYTTRNGVVYYDPRKPYIALDYGL
jgi:hypothetical protein